MINIKVLKDCAEVSYALPNTTKRQTKIIGISEIPALFDTKISYDSGNLALFAQHNAYGIQRIIQRDNQTLVFVQCINPFVNILHTNKAELSTATKEAMGIAKHEAKIKDVITSSEYTSDGRKATTYHNVHLPNMLYAISIKQNGNGQYSKTHDGLLCYKENFISDNTQLYHFPLSNTYKNSACGQICWGNVSNRVDNPSQAVGAITSFLGGIMNTHLYESININGHRTICSSEVLAYLALRSKEIESFPHDAIKLRPNIKYGELVSYVTQNWK